VPAILMLFAALVATGGDQPPTRQQSSEVTAPEPPLTARERATNEALLEALRQKRAEIARFPLAVKDERHVQARRYALDFLDRQIEKLKRETEQ
jgi:hypothetical protein